MKRFLKIAGITLASLVALFALLFIALILFVDPNSFKPELSRLVKEKTDLTLTINDKMAWTFWPNIGIKLGSVNLSDDISKENLAALNKAAVSVQLLPIFSGKIVINSVYVDGAKVRFIQLANGGTSWDRLLNKLGKDEEEKKSNSVDFNVRDFNISNTSLYVRDEKTDITREVNDIRLAGSNIGLEKDFPLDMGFSVAQQQGEKTLSATTTIKTLLNLDQKNQRYTVKNIDVNTQLGGSAFANKPSISLQSSLVADMSKGMIDVSALKMNAHYPDASLKEPAEITLLSKVNTDLNNTTVKLSDLAVNVLWPGKNYPEPINASLKSNIVLNWKKGDLNISDLLIEALGTKTTAAITAAIPAMGATDGKTPIMQGMKVSGNINTAAFNPRAIMASLGIKNIVTSDANVLKTASFSSKIDGSETAMLLKDMVIRLDSSTIRGEAGINDLKSMRQYARLNLDTIDADRYLAPAAAAAAPANKDAASSNKPAASDNAPILPIALLKTLNFDMGFNAGNLKIMQYPISNMQLLAQASAGQVAVKTLKGSVLSGSFSAPATISVNGAQPVINTQAQIANIEISQIVKMILKKDLLSGKANFTSNLTLTGNTIPAWKQSVNGAVVIKLDNAVLHGVNAMKEVTNALGKYQALLTMAGKDADTLANKQNDTEIASLSSTNTLNNGVLNTTSLMADLKKAKVNGTGSLNLISQDLNYQFKLNMDKSVVGEKNTGYAIPAVCKGNLAGNLSSLCGLDNAALRSMAAKEGTEAAAKKALDKLGLKTEEGQTATDAVKQEAQKKLQEGLNKLFNR